jgi:hypothetical protein
MMGEVGLATLLSRTFLWALSEISHTLITGNVFLLDAQRLFPSRVRRPTDVYFVIEP